MTEKRFSVKQRQGATIYSIIDYYGELPLSEGMYYKSNAEKLCKWLNTQHELLNAFYKENEQLKKQLSQLAKSNREGVKKVQSLAKEKENLKDEVYEEMDNALTVLMDLYEDTPLKSQSKMNNLYNRLESLREEMK